ncbi:MAG: hypothetical protein AAF393_17970 [Pseudomonadota bacterium]
MENSPLRLEPEMMVTAPVAECNDASRRVMHLRGTSTLVADAMEAIELRFALVNQPSRRISLAA